MIDDGDGALQGGVVISTGFYRYRYWNRYQWPFITKGLIKS